MKNTGIRKERIHFLNDKLPRKGKYILYWMQAAIRCDENPAMEFALEEAEKWDIPCLVLFVLTPNFPGANKRHYRFLAEGLIDAAAQCGARGLPFYLGITGPENPEGRDRPGTLPGVAEKVAAMAKEAEEVITDMGYLRIQREWREAAAGVLECPLIQVETEATVPVKTVSDKEEYSAATIRRKIHRQWELFLTSAAKTSPAVIRKRQLSRLPKDGIPIPPSLTDSVINLSGGDYSADSLLALLSIPDVSSPLTSRCNQRFTGGSAAAKDHLGNFLEKKLDRYGEDKNDPNKDALSNLSPYLHFGMISPVTIALGVIKKKMELLPEDPFLEELIVRRELSFNFTYFNLSYDTFEGALPDWAQKTLKKHSSDPREYLYTPEQFEAGETHDPYWNAAQKEMVLTGKMHGYMRMYWGKKILEWSESPAEAFETALYLNNKYELDGRDPNGFAGVAWCFGKHDRPWKEREIFGTVRYMNANGLKRKFDADGYAETIQKIEKNI